MAHWVRLYFNKQIRFDHLTFQQQAMFKIGNVGVASVKNRLAAALGPTDAPAKPLSKLYAIRKTKMGKGNRRDLYLTGDMLRNFQVRTIQPNRAKASVTTRLNRMKMWITNKIEPWVLLSPRNEASVREATSRVLTEMKPRLSLEKALNGKQQQ